MSRLGNMVDWSDAPARGAAESGVRPRVDASAIVELAIDRDDDDDEGPVTQRWAREVPPLPPPPPSLSIASARLEALLVWLRDGSPQAVESFVRPLLTRLLEVDAAIEALSRAAFAESDATRSAVQTFALAARGWESNLVEYVDELALTDRDALLGWTSVPEYSSMLVLAFVAPALAEVRALVASATDREGLADRVADVDASIARVEAALVARAGVDAGRATGSIA